MPQGKACSANGPVLGIEWKPFSRSGRHDAGSTAHTGIREARSASLDEEGDVFSDEERSRRAREGKIPKRERHQPKEVGKAAKETEYIMLFRSVCRLWSLGSRSEDHG